MKKAREMLVSDYVKMILRRGMWRIFLIFCLAFVAKLLEVVLYAYRPLNYLLIAMVGILLICFLLQGLDSTEWRFDNKSSLQNLFGVLITILLLFMFWSVLAELVNGGILELLRKLGFEDNPGIGLFAVTVIFVRRVARRRMTFGPKASNDPSELFGYVAEVSNDTIVGLAITSWLVFTFTLNTYIPFYYSLSTYPQTGSELIMMFATLCFIIFDILLAWRSASKSVGRYPSARGM